MKWLQNGKDEDKRVDDGSKRKTKRTKKSFLLR